VQCRFEDRVAGRALVLHGARDCICACAPEDLDAAFAQITAAQARGAWVGLQLDYELGEWLDSPLPLVGEGSGERVPYLTAWVFDHAEHTVPWSAPVGLPRLETALGITWDTYRRAIEDVRDGMARGDFYQTNFTFPIHVTAHGKLQDVYRAIANRHPSSHAVWFADARRSILSFSPELFVTRTGDTLTVRPMKGTAPRAADPAQDQTNARTLLHSEKDRAENLMIVDLLRNDLGRIATPGSVQTTSLFHLERYPSVWTLTSTVTAQAPGRSLFDIVRALFPCGSITGAPKIAAMQKLRQLEPEPRGIYCGSLGWLAPNGDFSLNVAIRTLEFAHDAGITRNEHHGRFGVGGGIVYDSSAELEWQECQWKARILDLSDVP